MACALFVTPAALPTGRAAPARSTKRPRMMPSATAGRFDRAAVLRLYDGRAATYDASADFHRSLRDMLAASAPVAPGARVLDLCCGTGIVAFAAAAAAGARGRVVGVDLSGPMIDVARGKAARDGVRNVDLRVGDVEVEAVVADAARAAGPRGGAVFDAVFCSAAQVWLDDLQGALAMWRKYVRPGGTVAFNAWSETSFVRGAVLQQVAWGMGYTQVPNWHGRTATPEMCRELLRGAGWDAVDVVVTDMSKKQKGAELKGAFRELIDKTPSKSPESSTLAGLFTAEQLAELEDAYRKRVDELVDKDGMIHDEITTYTVVGRNEEPVQPQ